MVLLTALTMYCCSHQHELSNGCYGYTRGRHGEETRFVLVRQLEWGGSGGGGGAVALGGPKLLGDFFLKPASGGQSEAKNPEALQSHTNPRLGIFVGSWK